MIIQNAKEIESWISRDIEAMVTMFYIIEPTYKTSIEGSTISSEMWSRLILEYANVAAANSCQLISKFHQYRMDPSKMNLLQTPLNHTNSFLFLYIRPLCNGTRQHIQNDDRRTKECLVTGTIVTEEVLIMKILQTLPPSYDVFQIKWNTVPTIEQTLTNLVGRLVIEERRLENRNEELETPAVSAFFAPHPSRIQQQKLVEDAYIAKNERRDGTSESN